VTPYKLWTGLKPNLRHLKIFGCPTYAHLPPEKCYKLDTKTLKCFFIGYNEPIEVERYRLYHLDTQRVFLSRDVIFSEDHFLSGGVNPSIGPNISPLVGSNDYY